MLTRVKLYELLEVLVGLDQGEINKAIGERTFTDLIVVSLILSQDKHRVTLRDLITIPAYCQYCLNVC